jgi:putative DNA primase/helicase
MTPLDAALAYAARGWPTFPCWWLGHPNEKHPVAKAAPHGFKNATMDPDVIAGWWRDCPKALVGLPTGRVSGFVVLDLDVKYDDQNGFDTLDNLGFGVLPETVMAHTASGGLHLYFAAPDQIEIRNTEGAKGRGIGSGLDWRGDGGYVIGPSPGSGYRWDPHWHIDNVPLAPVPPTLLPREWERATSSRPARPTTGLSPYAEAALDSACRRIMVAPAGEQEATLNAEAYSIGTLAAAGAIPADFAHRVLIWAARQITDHDPRRPWRTADIENKVERAFSDGMRHPRVARRA